MNEILAEPNETEDDEADVPLRGLGTVSPEARVACPRCEHDLRSEPMAWIQACPLVGRCLECGLEFRWADLLSRRRTLPRWSIEGAMGLRDWCRRWGPQWLMAVARPGVVHRRIRMEHPRRPWRLAAMLLPLLLVVVLVPMADSARRALEAGLGPGAAVQGAVQAWRTTGLVRWVSLDSLPPSSGFWVVDPRSPHDVSRMRWSDAAASAPSVRPADLATLQAPPLTMLRVERSAGPDVFVYTGLSGRVPPAVSGILVPPILVSIRGPAPWLEAWLPWIDRLGTCAAPLALLPVAIAGAFVFLPVVRRRARVSRGHIVRLMLLGLLPASTIGLGLALFSQWQEWPGLWRRGLSGLIGAGYHDPYVGVDELMLLRLGLPVALAFAACLAWTASAAAFHLRLQRPLAAAAASTTVGVVAVTTGWFIALV